MTGRANHSTRPSTRRKLSRGAAAMAALMTLVLAGVVDAAVTPDTIITGGPTGPWASRTATFSFTSTVAGASFQCKLDGGLWTSCTSPKSYTRLTQGLHTFRVRAKKSTKIDQTPAVRRFTVDTIAPNTSITSGPSGTTLDLRPEFAFTSSQAGSTFECSIDISGFTQCISPFRANPPTLHTLHTFQVRARDKAGNVDASPAMREFTVEPVSIGGAPYAQAAAALYLPDSVDLDVPAQCTTPGTDCPGGTPLPPSSQLRMQTTDLSVIYAAGTSRFDVSATITVQTLLAFNVQLPFVGDCTMTMDSSQGAVPTWNVQTRLQFTYDTNGDIRIIPSDMTLTGVESLDWQLSGNFGCQNASFPQYAAAFFQATLQAYWESVGIPLCEYPAPTLVGPVCSHP